MKLSSRTLILTAVFVLLLGALGWWIFNTAQGLTASWQLTNVPGVVITPTGGNSADPGSAVQPGDNAAIPGTGSIPALPLPPAWDGASPVSVLVMGLDYRDWSAGEGPPRTDTMILLTLDPLNKTAGMISIPRDLWVTIPGYGTGKINTAYMLGEANRIPGGGPALATQTVEALLGVPIDYYAQIDFSAFVRFIDEIGGVKIDVPEPITVDLIGDGKETKKKLKAGVQVLPGEWALAYARARYTEGGDFDRAQRQQQIILAIRDRVLSADMVGILLTKAPTLYAELSSGINTNLTLEQALQLGLLAKDIPVESIERGIIGAGQVTFGKSPDNLDILKPRTEEIRDLRDEIFAGQGAATPITVTLTITERIQAENTLIAIRNGSSTNGLAASTAAYLRGQGYNAPEDQLGNSDYSFYTVIIDYTGNPYTVQALMKLMGITDARYYIKYDPNSPVGIEIRLGDDWARSNPMP
ncbi:MAG: LCP family protein [Anaerolineales bacterium]